MIKILKFQNDQDARKASEIIHHGRMYKQLLSFINKVEVIEGVGEVIIDEDFIKNQIFKAEKRFSNCTRREAIEQYALLGTKSNTKGLDLSLNSATRSYGSPMTIDGNDHSLLVPEEGLDAYPDLSELPYEIKFITSDHE